tara:strand:- start:1782 stop:4316 length:2535 start_codon:yes stop_codon:yes gene_type:complete
MKFFLDLEFRIGQSLSKVKETIKSIGFDKNLSKSSKDVKKGLEDVGKSAQNTNKNLHHTSAGLKELQVDARNLNKSTAAANQTLFSFSDGLQDAAQFSQGFSQGMRAIGNNVAFTAELFSNLKVRVDQHNDAVSKGKIVNGQFTTVQDELKNALNGAGGMLIKLNVAVVASTIAFTALDKRLKKTTDAAKAQAEALADVAKSFSDLDTGVEDPFGLRARAIEIGVLNDVIGDHDSKKAIDDYFQGLNRNVGGLALFSKAILKVTSVFIDADEEFLGFITKLDELQQIQEGVVNTQKAYEQAIKDARPELQQFITITDDLEKVVLEQNTGIELTSKTLSELKEETEEVISVIGRKTERDIKDISTLTRLQKLLSDINGFLDDNAKKREKEQQDRTKAIDFFFKEREQMSTNNTVLQKELAILKETDAFKKISMQEELDIFILMEDFRLRQIALIKKMDDAGIEGQKRIELLSLSRAQRDIELENIRVDATQQRIDETLRQQAEFEAKIFKNQEAAAKTEEDRIAKEEELQKAHNKAKRLAEETLAKDVSRIRTDGQKEFSRQLNRDVALAAERNKKIVAGHAEATELMGRMNVSQASKDFQNALIQGEREANSFLAFVDLKSQHDIMKADERTAAKLSIEKKYQDMLISLGAEGLLNQDIVDQLSLMQADETSKAISDIDKKEKDAKIANAKGVLDSISFITDGLFKDSKAGAIASAVMNTYEAATKALASAPPPFGQILMGGTIAAGMAQVKKIISTEKGGGGGGATAGGGGGIGSRPRASGLFGTTETRGSANLNQPAFMPIGGMPKQSINVRVNNTFDDRTAATVVSEGNDHRREGAVSGLG